jgi:hypothetical protein
MALYIERPFIVYMFCLGGSMFWAFRRLKLIRYDAPARARHCPRCRDRGVCVGRRC